MMLLYHITSHEQRQRVQREAALGALVRAEVQVVALTPMNNNNNNNIIIIIINNNINNNNNRIVVVIIG